MTNNDFISTIQSKVARTAVGPSTVRGRDNTGAGAASRAFLRGLDLVLFGVQDGKVFSSELDGATERLRKALPSSCQHWGLARKVLNIFLRDSFYNTYLVKEFRLERAEPYYEIPLDSITAKHLRKAARRGGLPAWPGVINVTEPVSEAYQIVAEVEAKKQKIARVHLDAYWFSVSRDSNSLNG